jgi:splicing factor 3A subunit 1
MKIQNKYFPFFTQLAEIYKKILNPTNELEELEFYDKSSKLDILNKIEIKCEWDKRKKEEKKKEKQKQIEEGSDQIDWHDFVVVETIEFSKEDYEDLDNNIKELEQIEKNITEEYEDNIDEDMEIEKDKTEEINLKEEEKEIKRIDKKKKKEEDEDVDMELSDDEKEMRVVTLDEDIEKKVKKNYVKKTIVKEKKQEYFKDDKGRLIPIEHANEHLKVELIDPRWKDQKEREMEKFKTTNIVKSDQISQNIENFAKKRTDLIGSEEELQIGKSVDDKNTDDDKILWDGDKSTLLKTKGKIAAKKAEEMFNQKKRELEVENNNEETSNKKRKLNSIKIKIILPKVENNEGWNINSTTIEINLDPESTIDELKQLILKETNIPITKQRISLPGIGFLTATNSLSSYNIRDSSILVLSIIDVKKKN